MRNITKTAIPEVLETNHDDWLESYLKDTKNKTNKYRYRHPDIKHRLVEETFNKCAYCESKIGHNTPGDVEHKKPSKLSPSTHFDWSNLTIACTECNRRKNAYFSSDRPFLDPYSTDIEDKIVHHGPIVGWRPDMPDAEVSVRILELHDYSRSELIRRKIEKIEEINNLVGRVKSESGTPLGELLEAALHMKARRNEEFSGMVKSILETLGEIAPA